MSYSIKPMISPYVSKDGKSQIYILAIYNRMKETYKTAIKIEPQYYSDGRIIKHKNAKWLNDLLKEDQNNIDTRLLSAIRSKRDMNKNEFTEVVRGETERTGDVISDYMRKLSKDLSGKLSPDRLKHYLTVSDNLDAFQPCATFNAVSVAWLQDFEAWARRQKNKTGGNLDHNTVCSKMGLLKSVMNKARVHGLIKREKYEDYKAPIYKQKLPAYLTEDETKQFFDVVKVIGKPSYKLCGYYYYLSCNAGYRLGDAKGFVYADRVVDDKFIVLRAEKNGKIVSIAIHSRLREALDFIKDKPLIYSPQTVTKYVKEIAKFAGITKKIHFHTSRHSWAMLLISKGFTEREVAATLGDTIEIARRYIQINNLELNQKIMDRLG